MKAWNFGRGKGTKNKFNYRIRCVMCGHFFAAKRPDALTGSNLCRSALRRWRKVHGKAPDFPPRRTPAGNPLPGCTSTRNQQATT